MLDLATLSAIVPMSTHGYPLTVVPLCLVFLMHSMVPSAARTECYVSDHGASGNGKDYDTKAIQAAADHCSQGGEVIFQANKTYLTATIVLAGSVHVFLPVGSSIIAGTRVGAFSSRSSSDSADFKRAS